MARKEREPRHRPIAVDTPGFRAGRSRGGPRAGVWAVPGLRRGRAPRHRVLLLRPANNGCAHDPFFYRSLDVAYKEGRRRRLQRPARASSCADQWPRRTSCGSTGAWRALPRSATAGPMVVHGDVAACFARSPLGALIGAVQLLPCGAGDDVNGVAVHPLRPMVPSVGQDQLATMTEAAEKANPAGFAAPTPPGAFAPDRRVRLRLLRRRDGGDRPCGHQVGHVCGGARSPSVAGRRLEARRHTQRRPHRACTGDQLNGGVHRLGRRMSWWETSANAFPTRSHVG